MKSEMKSVEQKVTAACADCPARRTTPKPSRFMREHVAETGHTVSITRTKTTTYGPKDVKQQ